VCAESAGGDTYVAVYDYAGGNDGDLVFKEGDLIRVLDRPDNEWWQGESNGNVWVSTVLI
jgi:hypothetical protein